MGQQFAWAIIGDDVVIRPQIPTAEARCYNEGGTQFLLYMISDISNGRAILIGTMVGTTNQLMYMYICKPRF